MKKTMHSDNQKAWIAPEAIRDEKKINRIASHYQIHPNQAQCWKAVALKGLPKLFSGDSRKDKILPEKEKLI